MSVHITSPAAGTHLVAGQSLTVTATVDNPSKFKASSLLVDGKQVASDLQQPIQFVWASPVSTTEGSHTLRVSAKIGTRWQHADLLITVAAVPAPPPPPPTVAISPATLPNATQGQAYSQQLTVVGPIPPYTLRVTQGNLPAGISLGSDAKLTGTATGSGSFAFTISAFQGSTYVAFKDYVLVVAAGVPPPPPPPNGNPYWQEDFEDGALDTSVLIKWTGTEQVASSPWGGKALLLRTVSSTAGSGAPNSQMGCVYMNDPNSRGREGMRTVDRADLGLPLDYVPTPGQWNWKWERHISNKIPQNVSGSRAASSALGVWSNFTDRYTNKAYGPNEFVLVMRVMGGDYSNPYGSDANAAGTYHVLGPLSDFIGKLTQIFWDWKFTQQNNGFLDLYLRGTKVWRYDGPTLFRAPDGSSDVLGLGLYNYHPAVSRQIDVWFDNWKIGPSVASVQ